jgi:hypothetical protein
MQNEGVVIVTKCEHGVYDPHGDQAYCTVCNPVTLSARGYALKHSSIGSLAVSNNDLKKEPLVLQCFSCNSMFLINTAGDNGRPSCPVCSEEIDLGNSSITVVECSACTRTVSLKKFRNNRDIACPYCHNLLDVTALLSAARESDSEFDDEIDDELDEAEDNKELHVSEEENE